MKTVEKCEIKGCEKEAVTAVNNHEGDTLLVCETHERNRPWE